MSNVDGCQVFSLCGDPICQRICLVGCHKGIHEDSVGDPKDERGRHRLKIRLAYAGGRSRVTMGMPGVTKTSQFRTGVPGVFAGEPEVFVSL